MPEVLRQTSVSDRTLQDTDPFPDHILSEGVAQHKAAPKDPTTLVPHREPDLAQNLRGTGHLQNTARGNPVDGEGGAVVLC